MTMPEQSESDLCCPPDCCDMRGYLTFLILWELGKADLSGQEIAGRIAKRRGTKPTPGTLYPALSKLEEDKLILRKEIQGRKVIYKLTAAGRQGRDQAARYFFQVFGDIVEDCKVIVIKIGDCDPC